MKPTKYCPQCGGTLSAQMRDGAQRQICVAEACGYVHWNNPTPVVAAIVERDGEVLLARNVRWPPSWYSIITGFLEAGEATEAAVLREMKEELGLEGEVVSFVGHYVFPQMNQLIIAYHLRAAAGAVLLNEELADYKWVPVEKLKPWPGATGQAVSDWLARRGTT